MKGFLVTDTEAATPASPAPTKRVRFAIQYRADDGNWHWTCDAEGKAIAFTDCQADREILAAVKDFETRRIPWALVPNQLKQLSDCGNRKERRKERAARRRDGWRAEKRRQ